MYFLNDGLIFLYKIKKEKLQIRELEEIFTNLRFQLIDEWEVKKILERDGTFYKVFNTNFLVKKIGDFGYVIFELIEQKDEDDFFILKLNFLGYYVKSEEKELEEELKENN